MTASSPGILRILILSVALGLNSCWHEHDVVVIDPDGRIEVTATITLSKDAAQEQKRSSHEMIDRVAKGLSDKLRAARWDVEYEWINEVWPYELVVRLEGNIKTIESVPELYRIEVVEQGKRYNLRFVQPAVAPLRGSRTVVIKRRLFSKDADVLAPNGTRLTRVDDANERVPYTIVLE